MDLPLAAATAPRLELVAHTGSTNADLRAKADDAVGWPHLSTLVTRNQTAGARPARSHLGGARRFSAGHLRAAAGDP